MTSKNSKTLIALAIATAIILPTMAVSGAFANTTNELTNLFDETFTQKGAADQSLEDKMVVANNILHGEKTVYPYPEERQIAMDRGLSLILQIQTATSPEQKAHLESLLEEHKLEMLKYGLIAKSDLDGPNAEEWESKMREANLQNQEQEASLDKQSITEPIGYMIASILPSAYANPHTDDWHVESKIDYFENGFFRTTETKNTWDHANGSGYFWAYHNIDLPSYLYNDWVDGHHTVSNFSGDNPATPITYNYMTIWEGSTLKESCYVQKNYSIWHHSFKAVTYCSSAGEGVDEDDEVYSSIKVDSI